MIQNLNLEESQGTEQFVSDMEMVLLRNNGAHQNIGRTIEMARPQDMSEKQKEMTIVVS